MTRSARERPERGVHSVLTGFLFDYPSRGAQPMALLDRLRQELDRAGRQASRAIDEGRLRLDLYRAKQSLDRFAQRFGYASYRARKAGADLPPEEVTAHVNNLTAAEAEVTRLETLIAEAMKERKDWLLDNRPESRTASQTPPPTTPEPPNPAA
jgi:hypothetical protein